LRIYPTPNLGGLKYEAYPREIDYVPMKVNNRFHWASIPREGRDWAKRPFMDGY